MKNLFLALTLLLSSSAYANWQPYYRSSETEDLFDPNLVSRDAGLVRVWTLTNFSKVMTTLEGADYYSETMLTAVDCIKRASGAERVTRYAGKNAQGSEVSVMETRLRWVPIKPGSQDEALLMAVCR